MRAGADLAAIRERKPLIHQITNYVVMNETANATLALGALPVMAHAVEEVEEMASVAGALVLNIGTLSEHWIEAMVLAARSANAAGVPVVLDPVGAGATRLRTETAKRILDQAEIAVVRGNAAEVATLAGREAEIRGVESIGAADSGAELARVAASALGCVARSSYHWEFRYSRAPTQALLRLHSPAARASCVWRASCSRTLQMKA